MLVCSFMDMDTFPVQRNWSADQWPLSPPNIYKSWEMTPVYYKALDPHTVHAFIPIGQAFATATATGTYLEQDHELEDNLALIMMVLMLEQTQEQERHQLETFKDQTIWKYHSMTLFKKSDLQAGSHGWLEMTDNDQFSLPYTAALDQRIHNGQCDSEHEQNGSDDDYWGQYGDMDAEEDEEKENPSGRVDTPLDGQESSAQMSTNGQWHGQVKDRRDLDTEDDEDDYWVKYAEQQQEQEASERKRRLQQQQQQPEQQQDVALFSREDDGDAERSKPFQIDPAQLASLIQMYITQGTTQPSSPSIQEPSVTLGSSVTPAAGLWSDHGVSMTVASSSKSKIMDALRVVKQEASRSGYSKEEVLEMLDSIYEA
ncbi:hypothetical protein EDD11_010069 [Mortierella claussenii]|nr:hypothetical protein EDD11_010069 [Mortierella claussenii]